MADQIPMIIGDERVGSDDSIEVSSPFDGSLIATLYEENRQPVTLDQVSENMTDALIAIEDDQFYNHGGVDLQGIISAAISNISSDTTRADAVTRTHDDAVDERCAQGTQHERSERLDEPDAGERRGLG